MKKRLLSALLKLLVRPDVHVSWESCARIASQINAISDTPFFLYAPARSSLAPQADILRIEQAFLDSDIVVLYPHSEAAVNAAQNYSERGYLHTAYADGADGIRAGITSDSFALSTGETGFEERLAAVANMCSEPVLLIFDNFRDTDEDFYRITQLPAKIILIANEDMSDYDLTSLNITEE